MLHAKPRSLFSDSYEVAGPHGLVAAVNISWFKEGGSFRLDGEKYVVGRQGMMRGAFFVNRDGKTIAAAVKPSAFKRCFEVGCGERELKLAAARPFGRKFTLSEGRKIVGSVSPVSVWSRSAKADFPAEISLPVQVFMIWLVLVLWKRDRDAAVAGS